MLKLQVVFIAILIICVALVSCERVQKVMEPVADDMMPADDMMMNMMKVMDSKMYMSWASKALPAPTMTVAEAAAAMNPAGTGAAHNPGSDVFTPRTFYINDIGAVANKAGAAYPAGTMIFKEIMDETNTFVDKLAMMMKSDDPMYAGHNGWVYRKYARASADAEYMQVRGSNLEDAGNGCHGCHAKADNDSVFVSLSMDTMMDMDDIADDMMDDDMVDHGMMDDMGDNGMADDNMNDDAGAGDAQ
ncbi:MAG: cytochrome P460 family protein [Candidatus Poribacteria bacterium]|nr:cytochrome P460 family protein [Candidatus Poribacteria bacterium]